MKMGLLVIGLLLAVIVSIGWGTVAVPITDLIPALLGSADAKTSVIVVDIRMPRTLLAVLVGAGISASGAAIQGLFRNPLADPALIGVSAGAALFAALFVLLGGASGFALIGLAGSAFIGGLCATWIVLYVGSRTGGLSTMLLAGIAINAIALSGVGLLSYLSTDLQLRTISFWALGSLNGANWTAVLVALVIPLALLLLLRESVQLDVVTLGDEEAQHLGISHEALRRRVVFLAAVNTSVRCPAAMMLPSRISIIRSAMSAAILISCITIRRPRPESASCANIWMTSCWCFRSSAVIGSSNRR